MVRERFDPLDPGRAAPPGLREGKVHADGQDNHALAEGRRLLIEPPTRTSLPTSVSGPPLNVMTPVRSFMVNSLPPQSVRHAAQPGCAAR